MCVSWGGADDGDRAWPGEVVGFWERSKSSGAPRRLWMSLTLDLAPNLPQSLDHSSSSLVCHLSSLVGHSSSLFLTSPSTPFPSLITHRTSLISQPSPIPFISPFSLFYPLPSSFPMSFPPSSFLSILLLTFPK